MTSSGLRSVLPYRMPLGFAKGDNGLGLLWPFCPARVRCQFATASWSKTSASK